MRLLLLGANGQLGHALRPALAGLGEVVPATRDGRLAVDGTACETADLDRPDSLPALLRRVTPDVVVNAAAFTAVDRAETEREAAFRVNAEAVGALAGACSTAGSLLVHYSTDYVFSGDGTRPWREDDPVAPVNVYGASKLAGEEAIRASGCRHLVFRTAWVYAAHGHNFLRTMLRLGAERDEVRVVADQVGSPTPAPWIAQATAQAVARSAGRSGTWHVAASGTASWYDFAVAIFTAARDAGLIVTSPRVRAIDTRDFPTPARRPAYSCLDTGKLARDFGIAAPDWLAVLQQVIARPGTAEP